MISNQERRRVAKRLRGLEAWDCDGEFYDRGEVEDELGLSTDDGAWYDAGGVSRLADLIDRPTCTVVSVMFRDEYDEYEVELSCGDSIRWLGTAEDLAFCPSCGAEVVPDAERRD